MDRHPALPLDLVQIDHTLADVILVNELNRPSIGRPWITLDWLAYSAVFLRRPLLAAAAAIVCGPDVCGIVNDGFRSVLHILDGPSQTLASPARLDESGSVAVLPKPPASELTRMAISY